MRDSQFAALLDRVAKLEFAIDSGLQVSLADINVEEFHVLGLVKLERQKYERQKANSPPTTP